MLLLRGAYVLLQDGGAVYADYVRDGTTRASSHRSSRPNYELPLSGATHAVLLVGLSNEGTWIQSERHSALGWDSPLHLADYVRYGLTGRNQGSTGESSYTEQTPMRLRRKRRTFGSTRGHGGDDGRMTD